MIDPIALVIKQGQASLLHAHHIHFMVNGSKTVHLVTLRKMRLQSLFVIIEGNLIFGHGFANTLEFLVLFTVVQTTGIAFGPIMKGIENMIWIC